MTESEQIQCSQCGEKIKITEAVHSAQGKICQLCEFDSQSSGGGIPHNLEEAIGLSRAGQFAALMALLPFVLTFRIKDVIYTSIGGGVLAGLIGAYALIQKLRGTEEADAKFFGVIGVIGILAIYHVLNGVAII